MILWQDYRVSSNPSNPFGDETVNPFGNKFDESIPGVPRDQPSEPPLPFVPGDSPEAFPIRFTSPQSRLVNPNPPQSQKVRHINWGRLILWLFIIAASIPITFFMVKARQDMVREARQLSFKPAKTRISLSVNEEWQDLGFILRPGDRIVITATGEYSNAPSGVRNANGISASKAENNGMRSYDPLFPHGCLIARTLGKPTEVFHIGSGGILETDTGGRLQVRINDLDLAANHGTLLIEAKTFLDTPPNGVKLRGIRDSAITPIKR